MSSPLAASATRLPSERDPCHLSLRRDAVLGAGRAIALSMVFGLGSIGTVLIQLCHVREGRLEQHRRRRFRDAA